MAKLMHLLTHCVILALLAHECRAQTNITNVFSNISLVPAGFFGGARLLSLLALFTSLSHKFGGQGIMARCVGAAGKLRMLMPFLLYKLGMIVTTLGFLTLFSLKGLLIGIILLVLNAGGWLGKIAYAKGAAHGAQQHHHGGGGWHGGWHGRQHHQQPPVHIHVHKDRNDGGGGGGFISYSPPPGYGGGNGPYDSYIDGGGGAGGGHRGSSIGHSAAEYDPSAHHAHNAWSERISKGFNVNDIISRDLEKSGHSVTYPRRIAAPASAQDGTNPIR